MLCSSLFAVSPRVLQYAVDDLYAGVTRTKLATYGGILLLIAGLAGYFRYQMRRIIISASRGVEYDLRNDFFAHLERLPISFFHENRTGDLMSRATNDLSSVRMMVGPAVMYLANTLITAIVSLSLMFSLDVRLTLIVLLPLPIVSITVRMFGTAIHKTFEEVQEKLSDMSAVVQESLTGVRVVRAYRQEQSEIDRFRRANLDFLARNRRLSRLQGAFFPTMSLFLGISALLALWLGSRDVISGRITIGELVAFNAYLAQLAWPMIAFGWVTNLLERGMASWKRMLTVMQTVPAVRDETGLGIGDSGLRCVTHSRCDRVQKPELSVRQPRSPEQRVVLDQGGRDRRDRRRDRIGEVDAGEPPAAAAQPAAGHGLHRRKRRPGYSARRAARRDWVCASGAVPVLRHARRQRRVRMACRAKMAVSKPSSRQPRSPSWTRTCAIFRMASTPWSASVASRSPAARNSARRLRRAVVTDPRILILDDALSAVDTYTEEEILARLRRVMKARTSIIISHRISTVRDADQIVVLDAGRVVEQGRHDELIRLGGHYAELHKKQLLEEELAAS